MIPLYSSKKTSVKLTPEGNVIKKTFGPNNEKEYEIQIMANKLGVAPAVIHGSFDCVSKNLIIEMEYIKGYSLDTYLKLHNSSSDKKQIKYNLLNALNKLYNNGIDHRDLCGENIIITDKLNVKILDYGNAKVYPESINTRLRDYSLLNNKEW